MNAMSPLPADPDEDEYFHRITAAMEEIDNHPMDHVASLPEWEMFKRALARWVEKIDGEMDEWARQQEFPEDDESVKGHQDGDTDE